MKALYEKDDSGIKVHERGVIAQLCAVFRSHERGLPEWFKNSSSAYARADLPTDHRIITLLFGTLPDGETNYLALLDHVGMSVSDLESKFANWGDPEAHLAEQDIEDVVEGGHGNGGKCYMTQMFARHAYLHTVSGGRGCKYGFVGDDPWPGYFPSKKQGRGFPVSKAIDELKRGLSDLGVGFSNLPEEVQTVAAAREGFTLTVGIAPKHLSGKDALETLVGAVVHDPQMHLTIEKNKLYVVEDGKPVQGYSPVVPTTIEAHEFAPDPRVVDMPEELKDPQTGDLCRTRQAAAPQPTLVIRTSKVSMRWKLKTRHHIRFMSHGRPVAFQPMVSVSRSFWVDRMYGECKWDMAAEFETNERVSLAEAPVTRAVNDWITRELLAYEGEFKEKDKLQASQEERSKLQELNQVLDKWKNKLLDDRAFGADVGGDEGQGGRKRLKKRPLPQVKASRVDVTSPFSKAGIGVWLRMKIEFRDNEDNKVAAAPYTWNSSDWAVATVDAQNGVVTHMPGEVDVWVETVDGRLRSDPVRIQVVDSVAAKVQPETLEVTAGSVKQLNAVVTDRDGLEHSDVFMTWLQDDSSIVTVTGTGKIIGRKQGETRVYALDEHTDRDLAPANVVVKAPEAMSGDKSGHAYPQILLSEVDPDPLNPDGESVHLSADDGPVHQPTPQHVEHNIWWINLQCPLAKLYFEEYGADSKEWRLYHIERFIEALVKIRLSLDFQLAEDEITFDEVERRWREVASEVQRRALHDLRPLIDGEAIKGE